MLLVHGQEDMSLVQSTDNDAGSCADERMLMNICVASCVSVDMQDCMRRIGGD